MKLKNVVSTKYRNKYNKDFQWSNVLLLPIGGTMKIPYLRRSFSLFFEGADICDLKTERNKTFEGVMSGSVALFRYFQQGVYHVRYGKS